MREYETTFIIQPEITDEGIASLEQRLDGALENGEAIRLLYDDLGKRRLAYEIQNFQKGRYVTLRFLDGGAAIPGLERALRLEDSVMRFLTVQVNDYVEDVAARQAEAAEEQRIRAEKAAERAAREAEEAARLERERSEAELAAAAAAAAESGEGAAESGEGAAESGELAPDASDEDGISDADAKEDAESDDESSGEDVSDSPAEDDDEGEEEVSS